MEGVVQEWTGELEVGLESGGHVGARRGNTAGHVPRLLLGLQGTDTNAATGQGTCLVFYANQGGARRTPIYFCLKGLDTGGMGVDLAESCVGG